MSPIAVATSDPEVADPPEKTASVDSVEIIANQLAELELSHATTEPECRVSLTRTLGVVGWDRIDAVLLAALATGDPMLLVGNHGTAKSLVLERLADSLALVHRFYNASLVNYDDLVGIPVPNEDRTALRYINTPTAIWDAEVVLIDELNRTRIDLQNKLFPIIHERRVQGIDLTKLQYRWAAMNPPPEESDILDEASYLGADPLDPALADRFAFIVRVPDWTELGEADRFRLLLNAAASPGVAAKERIRSLVDGARQKFHALGKQPNPVVTRYLLEVAPLLHKQKVDLSGRRLCLMARNALGLHAARELLDPTVEPDWQTTLHLTLVHSLPDNARCTPSRGALSAIHRQAWELTELPQDSFWYRLLRIHEPFQRLRECLLKDYPVSSAELGIMVAEALADKTCQYQRAMLASILRFALQNARAFAPCVLETLADCLGPVRRAERLSGKVVGGQIEICQKVRQLIPRLGSSPRQVTLKRLLIAFIPFGYANLSPDELVHEFDAIWDQLGLDEEGFLERAP